MRGRPSIRTKLIVIATATSAVALLVFSFAFASRDREVSRSQAKHTLLVQASVIGSNSAATFGFGDDGKPAAEEYLQALNADSQIDYAALYDEHDRLFAQYVSKSSNTRPAKTLAGNRVNDNDQLEAWAPVLVKGEPVGSVLVVANLSAVNERRNNLILTMLMLAAGSVVISVVVASRLHVLITRPISALGNMMASISDSKDYTVRVEGGSLQETDRLANEFNSMLKEIYDRDQELKRALNEAKELADAAQAATEAKSQFLANMSHEIRTPMNGVIGLTSILLDTELNEEQTDLARTIQSSGEALLSVINDILDFSKAEAGKIQLEPEDFSLSGMVEEVVDLMAQEARSRGIELMSYADPQIPSVLNADFGRLRQVITNLVGNAIKFTIEGEVVVEAHLIGIEKNKAKVSIKVRDTGIGIPLEQQTKVFESFTQADGTSTRRFGGTGLGLTISKQIMDAMGGTISLRSEPGVGTEFTCTLELPIVQQNSERQESLMGLRMLVVDDNATNRKIIAAQLRNWGCACDLASSGAEAIENVRNNAKGYYAVAIMDMNMPEMNGVETTAEIRKLYGINELPIILLSSLGVIRSNDELRDMGISVGLAKPTRPARLHNALMVALNRTHVEQRIGNVPRADSKEISILLAEDNPVNRKLAERILTRLGYKVDAAVDGVEAIALARANRYDAILMDIQMPHVDGFAATAAIRALPDNAGKFVPIIAMTANAMQGDRERCIEAGMDDYIAKPFTQQQLRDVLGHWYQSKAA